MKNTIEIALYTSLLNGGLNILKQVSDPNKNQINFDELWIETTNGLKAGAIVGYTLDIIDSIQPQREIPPKAQRVWEKGDPILGHDSRVWRLSKNGRLMKHSDYGNRNSEYGWEKEHSKPKQKGGTDHINNLNPEHWQENLSKGTKYPYRRA